MIRQLVRDGVKALVVAAFVVLLAACGTEGDSQGAASGASDVVISGSVGDGPITGATVNIYNYSGEKLATVTSDIYAGYSSVIKSKGRDYPLLMEVTDGIDLVTGAAPDFSLYSAAIRPSYKQVNINPFTTLIVRIAQFLPGGINSDNISMATTSVMQRFGFGLDTAIINDPVTTLITDSNAANMIKASEALGEMVRRSRDTARRAGRDVSGNDVIDAIAADMTDGFLDGKGVNGTDPALSAIVHVVSAQVLVEALGNQLRVGGTVATDLIDQAITITRTSIDPSQLTNSVRITGNMLMQTRIAVAAAQVVDSGSKVAELADSISGISADSLPDVVVSVLPADAPETLENAVLLSSTASSEDTSAINQVVYNDMTSSGTGTTGGGTTGGVDSGSTGSTDSGTSGGSTDTGTSGSTGGGDTGGSGSTTTTGGSEPVPVNNTPVISGSPAGTVVANESYSFQPSASDADGDKLLFGISGKPGWAAFDNTTGRLTGKPTDRDVGSYGGIEISVTDGTDTAVLPAFNILVEAAIPPNTAPVISGTPAGTVVANDSYMFQPVAADADGDLLAFSITNKPGWAGFDDTTGRLSGTPAEGDVGVYGNIVIAVTDGAESAVLPAFSIQVEQPQALTGVLSLEWTAPVERSDGTPLSLAEIDGFKVHYGETAGNYTSTIDVPDGAAQSVTLNDLPVGTYYIVMTAYDMDGLESDFSAMVSKTVY